MAAGPVTWEVKCDSSNLSTNAIMRSPFLWPHSFQFLPPKSPTSKLYIHRNFDVMFSTCELWGAGWNYHILSKWENESGTILVSAENYTESKVTASDRCMYMYSSVCDEYGHVCMCKCVYICMWRYGYVCVCEVINWDALDEVTFEQKAWMYRHPEGSK